MAKIQINPAQLFQRLSRIEDWLYEQGFDQGFKDKALAMPVAAVAGVLIVGFMWIGSINRRGDEIKEEIKQMELKSKAVAEYREILAVWTKAKEGIMLPANKDPKAWLQEQMANLTKEANIELTGSGQSSTPKSLGQVSWQEGSFELRGTYHDLGRLLASIENHKPFIGVSQLDFQRMGDLQPGGKILLTVRLEVFALMEQPAIADAKAKQG